MKIRKFSNNFPKTDEISKRRSEIYPRKMDFSGQMNGEILDNAILSLIV